MRKHARLQFNGPAEKLGGTKLTAVDLFCGGGGVGEGLQMAGFHVVGASDIWLPAARTYQRNHPGVEFIQGDIGEESIRENIVAVAGDNLAVLAGGPPCQSFSSAGSRDPNDPRGRLSLHYLDLVDRIRPRCCLLENVVGILTAKTSEGRRVMDVIRERFHELGYQVAFKSLNAADFAVPQNRRRVILVATGLGEFDFGLLNNFTVPSHLTFREAVSDLPEIAGPNGETVAYAAEPQNEFQRRMRDGATTLTEHTAARHSPQVIERLKFIPEGRSALDPEVRDTIPVHLRPGKGFPNSNARICWDQPAPTITRNFSCASANFIHPKELRCLTAREAARCQSFRDNYEFVGSQGDKRLQIGNAVPPLFAAAIGRSVLAHLAVSTTPKHHMTHGRHPGLSHSIG